MATTLVGPVPAASASEEVGRTEWRRDLRVVDGRGAVDLDAATRAVTDLLVALGRDPAAEPLAETPERVARAYAELLTPRPFDLTTFPNDEGYDELVLARAIPLRSV